MPAYQTDIIRLCEKMLDIANVGNFSEDAKKRPDFFGALLSSIRTRTGAVFGSKYCSRIC